MKQRSLCFLLLIAATFFGNSSSAQLRLPSVLSSSMVLQQKDSVNLWGWGSPGAQVYITTGWDGRQDSVKVNNGARWQLKVATPSAGGPFEINIVSGDTITLKDVLVGEVWIASGQSNMQWSYNHGEKDIREELSNIKHPNIRLFQVPMVTSLYPQDDVPATWQQCDSNTIKSFSAVAYFFGKRLNNELNVPIGLINSSWGGTPAEVWTPNEYVENDTVLQQAAERLSSSAWWPERSGAAYNAMIAPLTNFNIAGAIWYQGESNTSANGSYQQLFTTMIDAWRAAWKKDFPFYYVQIAPYKYGQEHVGALLQEAQTKSMSHPKVGMVVITDLIDSATNIHPSRKREVGNRLANWALAENYGKTGLHYKSPVFKSMEANKGRLVLSFDNVATGFRAKDKKLSDFFIAGEDGQWVPAEAKIAKGKIVVWNRKLKEPRHVRYAFGNTLTGNVSTAEGLPLTPFRTDQL